MEQLQLFEDLAKSQNNEKQDIYSYWKLFIDGAARNNPGLAGVGIYLLRNGEPIEKKGFFVGIKTNNQAEYLALLLGLFFLKKYVQSQDIILIVTDSELLAKHLKGEYRVKNPDLKILYTIAKTLLTGMQYDIAHVLRSENKVADTMANIGIDEKIRVPQDFLNMLKDHGISL